MHQGSRGIPVWFCVAWREGRASGHMPEPLTPWQPPAPRCTSYELMDSNRVAKAQDVGGQHGGLQLGKYLRTLCLWEATVSASQMGSGSLGAELPSYFR